MVYSISVSLLKLILYLTFKCVTETKNVSVLFYKNLKSSFSTWLTHLTLRFLYIIGCSGPRCAASFNISYIMQYHNTLFISSYWWVQTLTLVSLWHLSEEFGLGYLDLAVDYGTLFLSPVHLFRKERKKLSDLRRPSWVHDSSFCIIPRGRHAPNWQNIIMK